MSAWGTRFLVVFAVLVVFAALFSIIGAGDPESNEEIEPLHPSARSSNTNIV